MHKAVIGKIMFRSGLIRNGIVALGLLVFCTQLG